jgi:type IV conjugative transfer system lipoprotein TraV
MKYAFWLTLIVITTTSGCASNYPCGEPSAGKCLSVTDNYKKSYTDYTNPDDADKPGFFGSSSSGSSSSKYPIQMNFSKYAQIPADGAPLLSQPKMMRVWLTPYTDTDNIYHDQAYEYVLVDKGRWNYANNKLLSIPAIRNVSADQVESFGHGGYGSYGLANQPPKQQADNKLPAGLTGFPAINSLQNQQGPEITTMTTGGGINRTTTITP